jgi:hypothetical protein
MYTISPKQTYAEVLHCIARGLVPMVTSSPGMGKSSIMQKLAKDFNLKLLDLRLSQCTPEDLQGFPMRTGDKATFTPFDIFPLEGEAIPAGYDGWLLFLDEATSATKPVQAAAYKLVLDRMVGSFKLHERVAIVMAGNKVTDAAVVVKMSTALQSRIIHFEMEVSSDEWLEYAFQVGLDHRVSSFISYMPSRLMDFRPDHQDKTFPCPRTWEFVSKLVKGEEIDASSGPRIAGTIGSGVAQEFITFAREFDKLPKLADIIAAPLKTQVPPETSTKYATTGMLIENFDLQTLDPILDYIEQFDIEMQILFCRGAVTRMPEVRTKHPKFMSYLRTMVRYLQ